MVDENDFDMDDMKLLDQLGDENAAAFDGIFDDDLMAEEARAVALKQATTANLFAASNQGFIPIN